MKHTLIVGESVFTLEGPDDFPVALRRMELQFDVASEEELRATLEALGGLDGFHATATSAYLPRYTETEDGTAAHVAIMLMDDLRPVSDPPVPVMEKLIAERNAPPANRGMAAVGGEDGRERWPRIAAARSRDRGGSDA